MFKANLRAGNLTFQIEGATQKDIFRQIAAVQEIFSSAFCGCCQSENLRFVVREVDGNEYYELHCQNQECRAKLAFGQSKAKQGTLFPKRKLAKDGRPDSKSGTFGDHNGWTKYRGKEVETQE